jgi:hypothetical protein
MVSSLPPEALVRLLSGATKRMATPLTPFPKPVLPTTDEQLRRSLGISKLEDIPLLRDDVAAILESVRLNRAGALKAHADKLASRVEDVIRDLRLISSFQISNPDDPLRVARAMMSYSSRFLDAVSRSAPGLGDMSELDNLASIAAKFQAEARGFTEDVCMAALNVPHDDVLDARGAFSESRLLAAYYGRYEELHKRLKVVLSVATPVYPNLLNAIRPAWSLIVSPNPLLTLRTATNVRELITSEFSLDSDRTAAPLRKLKLGVGRSAANGAGIVRIQQLLHSSESKAEKAELTLDLYRRMLEGQLRPWAWTILSLRGHVGSRSPELSSLKERLLADGSDVARDMANTIMPIARNAAAHEDYEWDGRLQRLNVGDQSASVDELREGFERAYAIMIGAEAAWRCPRTEIPNLAVLLDCGRPSRRTGQD